MSSKKILMFYGGWEGHHPNVFAEKTQKSLESRGLQVSMSEQLACLDDLAELKGYDLIVPIWTMGQLSAEQEKNLCQAVREGTGLGGFHGGMGDAFRSALNYEWMVGGRFVGHPYVGEYTVNVLQQDHPVMAALPAKFSYNSEQYYMQIDPAINVLADAPYTYEDKTVDMPVVWTKRWGQGRVFYSALGHDPKEFDTHPEVWDMHIEGLLWAAR